MELWQTIFAGLTFLVFAITGVIALVQLRELRLSSQLATASAVLQNYWTPQFQEWYHFVVFGLEARMQEAAYRDQLRTPPIDKSQHPEIYVCEYYTLIGSYVQRGSIPRDIFLANGCVDTVLAWDRLRTAVALMRQGGPPMLYRDFESLAALCEDWLAKHS